jgi:hypothetical protein
MLNDKKIPYNYNRLVGIFGKLGRKG